MGMVETATDGENRDRSRGRKVLVNRADLQVSYYC